MKSGDKMYAKRYRLFLIFLLAVVIGAGIWYFCSVGGSNQIPEDATLVNNFCDGCIQPWG